MHDPKEIIATLGMRPHPEGGHYVETWRCAEGPVGRGHATAIYFLLQADEVSHWHRVDAAEIWLWHAGAPLVLSMAAESGQAAQDHRLGPGLATGERPQIVVPTGHWQAARSTGAWTLVSCIVAPGFVFGGFELAPPNWMPGSV